MADGLDWDDLRYFLAVGAEGSTIAAAKSLKVNQSTVARRIAALEARVGQPLFERTPSGFVPTPFGATLLPHAAKVEEAVAAVERALAAGDAAPSGPLRLTCAEGMAQGLLTPLLDAFARRYPQITVEVIIADRYLDLGRREADIAVRAGGPGDDGLVGRKLADNAWALYASRSYVERYGKPLGVVDLAEHRLIALDGDIANIHAGRWLRQVAPGAVIGARSNSVVALHLAARSGVGVAALPVHIGDTAPDLVRVLDPVPELIAPVWILTHPDLKHIPRVRAFLDFAVEEVAGMRDFLLGRGPPTVG